MTTSIVQNSTLHNYMHEYSAMMSFKQLRDQIYTHTCKPSIANVKTLQTTKTPVKKTRKSGHVITDMLSSVNITHEPNDMIIINNDQYFSIIFNNFRKQRAPLSYLFYNANTSSLIVFIKNPMGFPMILVNIPNEIAKQNLYTNSAYISSDKCYTLPLNDEIFKNTSASKLSTYSIKYALVDGKIRFTYQCNTPNSEPNKFETDKISDQPIKGCFNVLFSDKVDQLSCLLTDETFDAFNKLHTMSLNIIAKQLNNDAFNVNDSSKCKNKLIITADGNLDFAQATSTVNKTKPLCKESDSIKWNINFTNINPNEEGNYEFELFGFSSMFKIGYNKMLNNDTRYVYYTFGQFYDDIYILCKIIASKELIPANIRIYNIANMFDNDFTTKEIYVCKTLNLYKK